VQGAFDARRGVSVISILLLLWSGTRVFGVLTKAMNTAFDESDHYGFFKMRLVELIMVLSLGLLFIIAMVSRMAIRIVLNRFEILPDEQTVLYILLQVVVPVLLLFVVFFLVYRFVPNRTVDARAALAGAIFTTLVIVIARPLFLGYLDRFAEYNLIYGSLAILVILIIWTWIMSMIILMGGQLTSAVQMQLVENKPQKQPESGG
jgi:membrane protein